MTDAFLFPGQGGHQPPLNAAFIEAWPTTRITADRIATRVAPSLGLTDTLDSLTGTDRLQPGVYAAGITTYAGLVDTYDVEPALVAGHSLGHLTAIAAAGGIEPGDGLALAGERGRHMAAAAAARGPGEMVAVLLADPDLIAGLVSEIPMTAVAAYNTPEETVVSGTATGIARLKREVRDRAERARFVDLDVAAAFHSPVMALALDPFRTALAEAAFRTCSVPVVSDVSGAMYTDPETARRDLDAQLTSPVDWVSVVETLQDHGIERVIEFPPAGTLSELVERTAPEIETVPLESPADAMRAFE